MKNIKKPKIAVLLAAFNGMSWINQQVDSIINQNLVDVTLYISVDKSEDGTYQWCKNLSKKNSMIRVLKYGDRYGGAAANFFRLIRDINFKKYDYVALADQDDIWLPTKIIHGIKIIIKKNVSGFSSDAKAFFKNGRETIIKKSYPQQKYDFYFEAAGPGCTYIIKSDALQKFKIFLTNNYDEIKKITLHDWLIYAFFRKNALKWYIDNKPLIHYRVHENNQFGPNLGFGAFRKRFSLIKNNWYRQQVQLIANLLDNDSSKFYRLPRLFLVRNFWKLRRNPKDKFIMLFFLITGVF